MSLKWSRQSLRSRKKANRILNILKAQYDLKDKSEAINEMARQYQKIILDSGVRPEYIQKLRRIQKEPILRIGNANDFRQRYGLRKY